VKIFNVYLGVRLSKLWKSSAIKDVFNRKMLMTCLICLVFCFLIFVNFFYENFFSFKQSGFLYYFSSNPFMEFKEMIIKFTAFDFFIISFFIVFFFIFLFFVAVCLKSNVYFFFLFGGLLLSALFCFWWLPPYGSTFWTSMIQIDFETLSNVYVDKASLLIFNDLVAKVDFFNRFIKFFPFFFEKL